MIGFIATLGVLLAQPAPAQPTATGRSTPAPPTAAPATAPIAPAPTTAPAATSGPVAAPTGSVSGGTSSYPTPAPTTAPVGSTPYPPAPQPVAATTSTSTAPRHYTDAEMQALQRRYQIDPTPITSHQARWKCLIADPTCGFNIELNATSAYAYRLRQGDVATGAISKWHSGRAQYDVWINIPTAVETRGRYRFTRMTLGPKVGIIASDSRDIWANFGFGGRYWFGRKRFSPAIEFSAALSVSLLSDRRLGGFGPTRSPIGITADVGLGIGGFGALIVGGQINPPLAREDIPESIRVSASGMFFVGFRGNILWGAPAALAVTTHAVTQRSVVAP